ncbi:protein of unknown function [Ruminococcaceae bacterium BL-4]|nr:protein of unknown function [Ruminococcaceae bacterium BL-4]
MRGLKYVTGYNINDDNKSHLSRGAWIEMFSSKINVLRR